MTALASRSKTAEALGVSVRTLDRLRAEGIVPEALRVFRVVRFDIDACRDALAQHAARQRPQWSREPIYSRAHLVTHGRTVAECGARGETGAWAPAEQGQPRCPMCAVIERKTRR